MNITYLNCVGLYPPCVNSFSFTTSSCRNTFHVNSDTRLNAVLPRLVFYLLSKKGCDQRDSGSAFSILFFPYPQYAIGTPSPL